MKQIYRKENRLLFSLLVGLAAAALLCGIQWNNSRRNVMAWWGSIYPEFCFSELNYNVTDVEKNMSEQSPKISFWLAKAFERW